MARPRSFDESELIETALSVFRTYGYSGATIRRLEDATGVGGRSLANTFGDKDGLFLRVLDIYHARAADRLSKLAEKPGLKSVNSIFRDYEEEAGPDDLRHQGCLMVTTAFDSQAEDPRIIAAVTAYRGMWRDHFRDALERAGVKKRGTRADFLIGAIWGAEAQIRLTRDAEAGWPVAQITLQAIKTWE